MAGSPPPRVPDGPTRSSAVEGPAPAAATPPSLHVPSRTRIRSAGRALPFLLRHPGFLGPLRRRGFASAYVELLVELGEREGCTGPGEGSAPSIAELGAWERDRRVRWSRAGSYGGPYYVQLYRTVRRLRPRWVVETGVASGLSTALVLRALELNGDRGRLTSIDLPFLSYRLPGGRMVHDEAVLGAHAAFVPERWRGPEGAGTGRPWELRHGDVRRLLPLTLATQGPLDLFIHDSAHLEELMSFEYELAFPRLRPGGVLVSDDVGWNDAFASFLRRHNVSGYVGGRLGLAVRPPVVPPPTGGSA